MRGTAKAGCGQTDNIMSKFPANRVLLLAALLLGALPSFSQEGKLDLGNAFGNSEFLPVDEAFRPMLTAVDGNTVEVSIQVAPGYYLYKDKIGAETVADQVQLGKLDLPPGEMKHDQYFGDMEVYHTDVFATLPLVLVFIVAGRQLVAGIMQGAVKG